MNKLIKNLFLILFPFYPIWSWISIILFKKPFDFMAAILLFPIVTYLVINVNKRLPKYVIFLILFTIYHVCSVFINGTLSKDTTIIYFILADPNILACLFFITIEYTDFDEKFITRMNKQILFIVFVSIVVSLIQVKYPTFFFNPNANDGIAFNGENRIFSIYSWPNVNSGGVSFPILISILVSVYHDRKFILPFVIVSAILFSFLTKTRYVMISALLVLSQLFFNKNKSIISKVSIAAIFIGGIFFLGVLANNFGYNINDVIDNRILEKEGDMESAKARVLSYEVFWLVFPKHPITGVGPETKKDVIELLGGEAPLIHIGYLSYLYFYGIFGCLFLFISLFYLLREAWRVGKRDNFWGSFYGLVSFCLANFTFVYFNLSEMGIVLSVLYIRYYNCKASLQDEEITNKVNLIANKNLSRRRLSLAKK